MLTNSPSTWSNNDLVAHNRGSRSLQSKVENIADGGLAARGVVVASVLFFVTMTAVLQALHMVQGCAVIRAQKSTLSSSLRI